MPKTFPKVYYGLHMVEGLAEYKDEESGEPYRILILENALKNMDPTYAGKPVYVQHVDEVDLKNLQNEADGYVLKSFFNPPDGKHWVEFIAVSDAAHEAIRRGWKLSNSYIPKSSTEGGEWHSVAYQNEITSGEYEHLAIVPNPRYTESVIMTPEEFKKYNEEKKVEIDRLTNAKEKGNEMPKFNFFKKQKVDNSDTLHEMSVLLPKCKKEITIESLINRMDEKMMDENAGMADMKHKVKLHDGSYCNVGELLEKHKSMCDEMDKMKDAKEEELDEEVEHSEVDVEGDDKSMDDSEEHPEEDVHHMEDADEDADDGEDDKAAKKKALQLAEHEDKEIEAAKKKKNAAAKKAASNSIIARDELERKRLAKVKAERLRNAQEKAFAEEDASSVEIMIDQIERGKSRYGSNI
jgi:Uncharacterized protein conserved in bacteria (DUF2213)